MSKQYIKFSWIVVIMLTVTGIGSILLNGWQHYASITPDIRKAQSEACVAKNRTWTPHYDSLGALIEIRCNKTKYLESRP